MSLVGYSPWGCKESDMTEATEQQQQQQQQQDDNPMAQQVKNPSTMQETQVLSLIQENPLEKEMATHPSTLAWKIPRTEEPGRLQSMGL